MRSRIRGLLTQLTALRHGGRNRRGLVVLGLVASAVALSAFVLSNALAGGVQEEGVFQLDGNALNTQNSTPAMLPALEDADNLCAAHLKVENTNPADEFCHPTSGELTRLSGLKTTSERSAFVTDGSGAFASGAALKAGVRGALSPGRVSASRGAGV